MAAIVEQQFQSHIFPDSLILSEEEDADLREVFQQCIEIHRGQASLAELAMLFCRSHFAGMASLFVDCYGEFVEVWQLARPLILRRYLLKHRQTFAICGTQVNCFHDVNKTIPTELLHTVWYIRTAVLEKYSGTVKLSSLVDSLLGDPSFVNSLPGRVTGETNDDIRRFVTACYSVFKVDHSKDIIYVVGSRKTLVDPVAKNAVDEILRKLRIKPRKISELVSRVEGPNVMIALSSMYTFLSSFPFVFEVKRDNGGLDGRVFSLQKHDNGLYKALDEINGGKDISCPVVAESFQFCLKLLRNNWGRMDLGSQLFNFTDLRKELRHLAAAVGSDRPEVVSFLSVFPSVFVIEQGRVILQDDGGRIPQGLQQLCRDTLSCAEKANARGGNVDYTTKNSTSQAAATGNGSEKRKVVATNDEDRLTDEIVEICVNAIRRVGGLVPCEQLTLENLADKCANYVLQIHGRRIEKPLVSLLEKFPTKFCLTPDRVGLVLTELINDEEVRLRSSKFRALAEFLASDVATYSGLLTVDRIASHAHNVSPCTFKNANVVKGNVTSIAAFLASFPSLFWLERSMVHVNPGWCGVLWPAGRRTGRVDEATHAIELSTQDIADERVENRTIDEEGAETPSINTTLHSEVIKECAQCLKRFGGIMSTKWLSIRVRNAGQLDLVLKCPRLHAEKRLLGVLVGHPTVFRLTPDQGGVILTEVLSKENERIANTSLQDLIKAVVSKLVASEGIPLPAAAISRCVCLSRDLKNDTFKNAHVPREDSACLGAFLASFPSLFAFESSTFSGRVSLKEGWRGVLHAAGLKLSPSLNSAPKTPCTEPRSKAVDEKQEAYNAKFEFCVDTLQLHGGTTSLDALVTEFQYLQDRRVETWLELQQQFSALLHHHPFHFLLTADRRGVVLRDLISKERERLTSPVLKDFVTHIAIDLANDGGSLPVEVLSHHLLRLSDEMFRKANVFKGDCGSLEAFLASFPSVFCFDKTGDVVNLTKNWLSVSNCAERTELAQSSADCQEPVALLDEGNDGTAAEVLKPAVDVKSHSATPGILTEGLDQTGGQLPGHQARKRDLSGECLPINESAVPDVSQMSTDERRLCGDDLRVEETISPRELTSGDEKSNQRQAPSRFTQDSLVTKRLCFTREGTALYSDSTSHQHAGLPIECGKVFGDKEREVDSLRENEGKLYLQIFPPEIQTAIEEYVIGDVVTDVVMDIGRKPELRYMDPNDPTRIVSKQLNGAQVTQRTITDVLKTPCLGPMSSDNRRGIEGTLHRISVMKNRRGQYVGLTARYGRAIYGCLTDMVYDLACCGKSVLVLGEPGAGKTTVLREFARVMSDDLGKRVLVVDTSNEIAGEGDIPHIAVGGARRIMVHPRESQHLIMAEGFRNHNPEVIVVDEISAEKEAEAARLIAQRGVQLVASAHADRCEELVNNETLWPLIGGLRRVCLSAENTQKEGVYNDAGYERMGPTTFGALIEVQKRDRWLVHLDLQASIDAALLRQPFCVEIRERIHEDGRKIVRATPHKVSPTHDTAK